MLGQAPDPVAARDSTRREASLAAAPFAELHIATAFRGVERQRDLHSTHRARVERSAIRQNGRSAESRAAPTRPRHEIHVQFQSLT